MKVIIIGSAYPYRGGIAHYTGLLYKALLKRGHIVKVVTFKRQYPRFLFPGKTQVESGGLVEKIETSQLIDSINPFNWLRVGFKVASEKPDIVIFKYWMPFFAPCFGTIALIVKTFSKAKILFICHNIVPHERTILDTALTKFAFLFVDHFIVQSSAVESDLLKIRPGASYKKVYHPVYEIFGTSIEKVKARQILGLRPDEKVLLFFGYVREYKGLDILLRAMKFVLANFQVKLLVVGEFYDKPQRYYQIVEEDGISDHVIFKNEYVKSDEVKIYFSASDVVVLPYKSATQSGIVKIAYNFNKPVIATNVGGLPEVVLDGKTGFIVEPSPQKIADAIVKFFRENLADEFSKNVELEKKKYSWDALVEAIESFVKIG